VYDQTLEAALLDLGLDARGVATSEGWQVDAPLLRSLLRRLRGICTHPQVSVSDICWDNTTPDGSNIGGTASEAGRELAQAGSIEDYERGSRGIYASPLRLQTLMRHHSGNEGSELAESSG
jgi:hypothetical protein